MAFTSTPILCPFDSNLETILQTDALDYIISGVLSQKHLHPHIEEPILHPVAIISEKISSAKCNYGISNKELLAIISS